MPAKTIFVITNASGLIDLGSDEVYHANEGKSIAWECDNPALEQLTISFNKPSGTPFKNGEATFQSSRPGQHTNVGTVKQHSHTGQPHSVAYDYNVAVKLRGIPEFNRDPQVVIDVDSMQRYYVNAIALVGGVALAIWGYSRLRKTRSRRPR